MWTTQEASGLEPKKVDFFFNISMAPSNMAIAHLIHGISEGITLDLFNGFSDHT